MRATRERPEMTGRALVTQVSTPDPYVYSDMGRVDVAVVDYGCKRSILRRLAGAGARVTVYPHDVDADTLAAHDAVCLSNGPGDPEPLRAEPDRAALLDGLRNGNICAIASDHAPHARHEKEVPFEAAPFGVTGLETAFAVLYTNLVEPGLLPLETLLERMSAGPARAYGLEPPRIAVGAPANLVLFDPNASWRVKEETFRSRSANSWLLGQTLRSKIRLTVAAGRVAFAA